MNEDKVTLLEIVFDCLIDTAKRTTDLESVYNDADGTSVYWEEVYAARDYLRLRRESGNEI
jgi:hypothetical protein